MCLLTILHQCTEAVQCKHSLLVMLTENKKFNLRFDSRQSRTGHPQSKILATPMKRTEFNVALWARGFTGNRNNSIKLKKNHPSQHCHVGPGWDPYGVPDGTRVVFVRGLRPGTTRGSPFGLCLAAELSKSTSGKIQEGKLRYSDWTFQSQ